MIILSVYIFKRLQQHCWKKCSRPSL